MAGIGRITLEGVTIETYAPEVVIRSVEQPLPDEHPFYNLIGRVAAGWARLEHELDLIIWGLARSDKDAISCITAQIGSCHAKLETIGALAALRRCNDKITADIATLQGRLGATSKKRNRYVHDAWLIQPGSVPGQFVSFSAKGKKFGFFAIQEKEIKALISEIDERTTGVSKLRSTLLGKPKP